MPTITTAARIEAVPLDLDARLALSLLAMDERLDQAAVAFEVNTAHLPSEPTENLVAPILPAHQLATDLSPIADCLHRARTILAERGWCTGGLRDEQGAVCVAGAIRAAAHSRGMADDACALLLEAIQREFTAETVPSWNDAQHGPAIPMRLLGHAADLAASRGI